MGTMQKLAKELDLPIVDAKKHIEVSLTNRDIRNSSMQDPTSCAFAKACRRKEDVVSAYFFLTTAYLQFENRLERYVLPPSMRSEIVAFDRGGPSAMEAGIYRLSPPGKTKRIGKKQSSSVKSWKTKKVKAHRSVNVRKAVV